MEYFIELEGQLDLRLYYCVEYQCFELGIRTCEAMKNREKMVQLGKHIEKLKLFHLTAMVEKSLNNEVVWKTTLLSRVWK